MRGYDGFTLGDATQQSLRRDLERAALPGLSPRTAERHATRSLRVVRSALEPVRRPRIAAIIPVLDEEGAIGAVVAAIPRDWVDEIIVVDGGSRDRTVAVASAAGARVIVESDRGYGRACATGAAAAVEGRAEILVFLDGDGSDRPEEIPRLVQPILDGKFDFVIGSRTRGMREKGSMGAHQVARRLRHRRCHRPSLRNALHRHVRLPGDPHAMHCCGSACAR